MVTIAPLYIENVSLTRSFADSKLSFIQVYSDEAYLDNLSFTWNKRNAFDVKEWAMQTKNLTQPLLSIRVLPIIWGNNISKSQRKQGVFLNKMTFSNNSFADESREDPNGSPCIQLSSFNN